MIYNILVNFNLLQFHKMSEQSLHITEMLRGSFYDQELYHMAQLFISVINHISLFRIKGIIFSR